MPPKRREKLDDLSKLLRSFLRGLGVTVILLLIFISISYGIKSGGAFLLISGAYFTVGIFLGFLFGMPRSNKYRYNPKAAPGSAEANSPWYTDNTNLEDISDWLTKIIVGLSLVSFEKILHYTDLAARSISMNLSGSITKAYSLSYALIVLFIAVGFIISYLWSFTILRSILIKRKKEDDELTKPVADAASSAASQEKVKNQLNTFTETELKLREDAPADFIKMVNEALNSHHADPKAEDDPQKNRWAKSSNNNGKQLDATVKESKKYQRFFDVELKVFSTDNNKPLTGWVAFFVHDSFGFEKDTIYARVVDGMAAVPMVAYEAFTVGALCEDGTALELDLNDMKNIPENFRWKDE